MKDREEKQPLCTRGAEACFHQAEDTHFHQTKEACFPYIEEDSFQHAEEGSFCHAEEASCPRILIAGTGSGCGKTTLTCGILYGLLQRGLHPFACKCGPDYIDSMFHSRVLGVETGNLDSFFTDSKTLRGLLARGTGELCVIEGVMGYYDGCGFTEKGSASEIAALTETPVILTINARGMSRSVLAVLRGFLASQKEQNIRGVIFNQLPAKLYPDIRREAEAMGVRALGFLPRIPGAAFESRKLGLVAPAEIPGFRKKLELLYETMKETIDWDGIVALAGSAPALPRIPEEKDGTDGRGVKIAVARDEAFCFLYRDNMEFLKALGCEILFFSPLRDKGIPEVAHALILNGGYPELHAAALEANSAMRRAVSRAVKDGMPVIAECGGFMYLHDYLQEAAGKKYEMAGVLHGGCYKTSGLTRFGYITMKAEKDGLLCRAGETLKAHEFHYYDSTLKPDAFTAEKADGSNRWTAGVMDKRMYAGFPHLYFYGNKEAGYAFVRAAKEYGDSMGI